MITTAVPEGEADPTIFVLDVRDRPWDGSAGLKLIAEWDGMGMAATQSHAMRLEGAPAVRLAWNGARADHRAAGPLIASLFTAVILGVLDEAIGTAREQLRTEGRPAARLRTGRVVTSRAGPLGRGAGVRGRPAGHRRRRSGDAFHAALRAKEAVAELAEAALLRITRVLGGGTFSQRSPFAHWFEDVRALGFLRPPWGLAYDNLFATSID